MTCIDRISRARNSFQGNVPWSVKYQHDIHANIWYDNGNFRTMSQDNEIWYGDRLQTDLHTEPSTQVDKCKRGEYVNPFFNS